MIFDIQRYSTHDGRGIRTNLFFKGCPLRCAWCSNPESQQRKPEILFDGALCMGFGDCMQPDPGAIHIADGQLVVRREAIRDMEVYREICPARALRVAGETRRLDELIHEVEKDLPFYQESGGGVTLTGGEPFSQGSMILKLIRILHERKIHIAVETSLHVPWEQVEPAIGMIDEFLVDLKHVDRKKFRKYTGGDSRLVIRNLAKLDAAGVEYVIRIPVIPGFNHSMPEMEALIDLAATFRHVREIHFIPYHRLGKGKYTLLGRDYDFPGSKVDEEEMVPYLEYANQQGFKTLTGG